MPNDPSNPEGLPAGAIVEPQAEAPTPEPVAEPAAPQEAQLPLSAVLQLLDRQVPQAPVAPVAPAVLPEVQQLNRFLSDQAWAAQAMRQMSNGRLNPEDPVHVALCETELRNRANTATMRQEFQNTLRETVGSEVSRLRAEQAHQGVQSLYDAELSKPVFATLDRQVQEMLAENVGRLVYQGKRTPAQAIKETFGPVEKLLAARGPVVPTTPRVTPAGHVLNPPNSGAGAGAPKLGGRAALNQAYQNIRNGVRKS